MGWIDAAMGGAGIIYGELTRERSKRDQKIAKYPISVENLYQYATSTKHKLAIDNLEKATKYIIQVAGVS